MDNRRNALLFAVVAALIGANTATVVANKSISEGVVVVLLVVMGVFLFIAGYYAGLVRSNSR